MANPASEFDEAYFRQRPRRSRAGLIGWLLFLLVAAGGAAFVKYRYLPERAEEARLKALLGEASSREKLLKSKLAAAATRTAELETKEQQLWSRLQTSEAERDKLEGELKGVQSNLQAILEPQISAGNVKIRRRGNELVVELAAQILFESGSAELNDPGKKVLSQVAGSLATLKSHTIQVGGHTDQQRVSNRETQERFPTNWELSTARATNVVRFLEDRGKLPGSRLVAAGFSQFRPVASNATEPTRQKNRRIELVLLPAQSG
ncbi:MAG: flagellar motor protein MotB [Myxococcota bacterium]|jgi:chemotaxis protein MotB|nr:flagellar motor protein MotB [Myxococcota bacterium]